MISFERILRTVRDPDNEGEVYFLEKDIKNQGKRTIKVNVEIGEEVLGRIDMPTHYSALKELDRGRLLFFVKFRGGRGYLDSRAFAKEIENGK